MSDSQMVWQLWKNPLVIKGCRQRLRRKTLIGAGAVTLIIASFIYFFVYLGLMSQNVLTAENAAKTAFLPIFILQGFILMFLGTGSVATGITEERAEGLLNYHRLTPMSPASKIIGYLFGLAAREYYMFALTLPFVAFAIIYGGLSPLKVGQLYLVFFTCVILYHLTGLVAGMVARKPRRASWFARIMVVILYLFLPLLGELGFTFLSYFTVAPTFNGLVRQETLIGTEPNAVLAAISTWREVPFFTLMVTPTVYSLLMQGFLITTFFTVVYRKWKQESNHAVSKVASLAFYAMLQFLVVGSLWAFFSSGEGAGFARIVKGTSPGSKLTRLVLLFYVFFAISGLMTLLLINVVTPTRHAFIRGLRRARKHSRDGIPLISDSASSLWYALGYVVLTGISYLGLISLAESSGVFFSGTIPWGAKLVPMLLFAPLVLYIQATREYWGGRGFLGFLGIVWLVPLLLAMVVGVSVSQSVIPLYLLITSPPAAFFYGFTYTFQDVMPADARQQLHKIGHLNLLLLLSLGVNVVLAGYFLFKSKQRQLRDTELELRGDVVGTAGSAVAEKRAAAGSERSV